MAKHEPSAVTAAEVRRLVRYWLRLFEMRGWEVQVRVNDSIDDCDEANQDAAGYSYVEEGYSRAVIGINAYRIRCDELRHVVAHEFVHVVLWRLSAVAEAGAGRLKPTIRAISEEAVESISRVLVRLSKGRK